jgi:hypothetical protein
MWDVSSVTVMHQIFENALAFNQNLSPWNVDAVTDMRWIFNGATAFSQTLCWDTSGKTLLDSFTGGNGGSFDGSGAGVCEPTDAPSASPSATASASPSASPVSSASPSAIPVAGAPCDDATDCPAGSSCDMDVPNVRRRLFFDDSSKKQGKCTA